MAKVQTALIKLQCVGGQATPAPPVGPALGAHGVNIGMFVKQFNDKTQEMKGVTLPVVITVYNDRSFDFRVKSPPAAVLLKMAAGIPYQKKQGSSVIVHGVPTLSGAEVMASDIRGGASLVVAALAARGKSTIHRIYHIDRGYEALEGKLRGLGARIGRRDDGS